MYFEPNWLQRFAEGGAGAAGAAGTAGATGAAAGTGAYAAAPAGNAASAAPAGQKGGKAAGGKGAGTAAAPASAAANGANGADTPEQAFEALITGQYKDLYDAKVQGILNEQTAKFKRAEAASAKMQNVMDVLAQRYGKDVTDYDGILSALDGDTALYEAEAAEAGMDVSQFMRMKQLERQNSAFLREQEMRRQEAANRAEFAKIAQQGEALKQKYPNFDLRTELSNPNTVKLLKAGIALETVYEVNHRREMQAAAAAVGAQRVAAGVAENQSRAAEAGGGGTGVGSTGVDPAHLTREQREDIKRRVANGERIVLSSYAPKQ